MNRLQYRIRKGLLNALPMIAIQMAILLLGFSITFQYPNQINYLLENNLNIFAGLLTIVDLAFFIQGYIKAGN